MNLVGDDDGDVLVDGVVQRLQQEDSKELYTLYRSMIKKIGLKDLYSYSLQTKRS